jgi:hypothetical protein
MELKEIKMHLVTLGPLVVDDDPHLEGLVTPSDLTTRSKPSVGQKLSEQHDDPGLCRPGSQCRM